MRCTVLCACLLPATAAYPQSVSDLLSALQQVKGADALGAIKSVSDILQGQLAPGTGPRDAEGKFVLYRTAWCDHSKRAAAYMRQKNIPFIERDIDANRSYLAEYKKLGAKGVPFIVAGDKTLTGFTEASFEQTFANLEMAPTAAAQAPALPKGNAGSLQAGQSMIGKIAGVKVHAQPSKASPTLLVLGKTDEVIYMGEERDGLYRVTTQQGEGWIDKLLLKQL